MVVSKVPTMTPCLGCRSQEVEPVLTFQNVPVLCNILCETKHDALSTPRGDIRLTFCKRCGLIYNALFDRERVHYSQNYESSRPSFTSLSVPGLAANIE